MSRRPFTPRNVSVVQVRDILLVTVPSDPDDLTLYSLQEQVLDAMEHHEAKGLIIDISAIETLDSFFARTIAETGQMVKLMGGITVIAGMRPRVAITTTQLGLTFSGILTALNVDRALDLLGFQDSHPSSASNHSAAHSAAHSNGNSTHSPDQSQQRQRRNP